MAKLGEICEKKIDTINSNYTGIINYIDISSVDNQKKMITDTQRISFENAPSRAKQLVIPGDILVSTVRPNLNAVALVTEATDNVLIASTGYCVLRCLPSVDNKYVFYFCQSSAFVDKLVGQATGASYPAVTSSVVKECSIPLPDLEEQRHIATVLDKVTDLIAKRRAQLDKLDLLVKSRFVEMFGDPFQNPFAYPPNKLSEYIEFLTSGSRGWAQYFSDKGEYFITIKNVKNCGITLDNMQYIAAPNNAEAVRTRVQEGDLLISITADLGRTGVVTKEIAEHGAYINQHLTCIRLVKEKVLPLYVAYYLESPAGKSQFAAKNQNGVKAGLNFNAINSLEIMVPPLDKQAVFVSYVNEVNRLIDSTTRGLFKLETLKKSLMQQYFCNEECPKK